MGAGEVSSPEIGEVVGTVPTSSACSGKASVALGESTGAGAGAGAGGVSRWGSVGWASGIGAGTGVEGAAEGSARLSTHPQGDRVIMQPSAACSDVPATNQSRLQRVRRVRDATIVGQP